MRVGVLAGGLSLERSISLVSGQNVVRSLADEGVDARLVDVDADVRTALGEVDVAVLALHGEGGEDGLIQGVLEGQRIPFTGPSSADCRLSWDKMISKGLLSRAGIAVPRYVYVSRRGLAELGQSISGAAVEAQLGFPVIVKPARGGSAMGVSRVEDPTRLGEAIRTALSVSDDVLIEELVVGQEVAVSLAAGFELPVARIEAAASTYDFETHYTPGLASISWLDAAAAAPALETAARAWELLGGRDIGRVDMIIDGDGVPWVLEVAATPGITETSIWPNAVEAAGHRLGEVVRAIAEQAVARGAP